MVHLETILKLTLLYTPFALGVIIVFRIAKFPDLTVDGSFAVGGAVSALLISMGHPFISLPASLLVGGIAGLLTASLYVFLNINKILSGILVMTALYSINLRAMGSANMQLINYTTSISFFENNESPIFFIVFLVLLALICILSIFLFFRTEIGLYFRAGGQNIKLIRDLGKNQKIYICLGPVIGNSLIGLSGGLVAQYQGFADVNMGFGALVTGLAFLFIGGAAIQSNQLAYILLSSFVGTLIYESAFYFSLSIGLSASDLKIITAIFVILGLVLSRVGKNKFQMEEVF